MANIDMVLDRKGTHKVCVQTKPWVRHWASLSGYLDIADMVSESGSRRMVFGFDKPLESEQIQTTRLGIRLTVTRQREHKTAQVMSYEPALKLLAELYDEVALSVSSLTSNQNRNTVVAVGMLAAAGLCEVSPETVRLSVEGKEFVELLMGDESLVCMQD